MGRTRIVALVLALLGSLAALSHRSTLQAWASGIGTAVQKRVGRPAPELPAGTRTLDGVPLRLESLRGRVVLLHFWTFGCSNCKKMLPRYAEWHAKYKNLAVIGVHTPEMDYERDVDRLRGFVRERSIAWPVVVDANEAIWDRYGVEAWPTIVLIDRAGTVRAAFIGDDRASEIESALKALP